MKKSVNWNTVILIVGMGVSGFFGRELWAELRSTHDSVITIRGEMSNMVNRNEFEAELMSLKVKIATVEIDLQRLKNNKP